MRLRLALISILALGFGLLSLQGSSAASFPVFGSRLTLNGSTAFLAGANLPWYNYGCDFGCGDTGTPSSSGVSNATNRAAIGAALSQAHDQGLRVIRWWMFEGGAASNDIGVDSLGIPAQITANTYKDIDAAMTLANQYDLYFDFVFFSSPTAITQNWVTDPNTAVGLATTLGQLAGHYAGNPRIFSWEIYNEPETDIWAGRIDQASVQASVKSITTAIHANSKADVTVGSVFLDGLPMWVGLGLDYYEAHWYDYMNQGNFDALLWDYPTLKARYNLDKPLVIGEFPAAPTSSNPSAAARWQHWYDASYAGAWSWSLLPSHTADGLINDDGAAKGFTAVNPTDKVPAPVVEDPYCFLAETAQKIFAAVQPGSSAAGIEQALVLGRIWQQCVAVHGEFQ